MNNKINKFKSKKSEIVYKKEISKLRKYIVCLVVLSVVIELFFGIVGILSKDNAVLISGIISSTLIELLLNYALYTEEKELIKQKYRRK
jgi:ribosomal protein L11 methylase PrmA